MSDPTPNEPTVEKQMLQAKAALAVMGFADDPAKALLTWMKLFGELQDEKARAEKFKRAVLEMLENNGGPIDGFNEDGTQETSDGKDYVMVLREDFERLEAMVKETEAKP